MPATTVTDAANALARTLTRTGASATIISDATAATINGSGSVTPDAVSGILSADPDRHPFVPPDEYFDDDDYLESRELEKIGAALIAHWPEFGFLQNANARIAYRWKRKGGKAKGKAVLGQCQKPSGLLKHFADCDFVIWIAADHARVMNLTNRQMEALVYHELSHCWWEEDEDETSETYGEMRLAIRGHDDELFWSEIARYGPLDDQRKRTAETFQQVALPAGRV